MYHGSEREIGAAYRFFDGLLLTVLLLFGSSEKGRGKMSIELRQLYFANITLPLSLKHKHTFSDLI